jgi:HD-GYP domain-containing protein (c-di-GMP phosphodiesterase class II)
VLVVGGPQAAVTPPELKAIDDYLTRGGRALFMVDPKAGNIGAAKEGLHAAVDLILRDDETALQLTRITCHDFYTYTHSVNVGMLASLLARELFADDEAHDLRELGAGFFLHDLGKTRVAPAILNNGRLDAREGQMRATLSGIQILRDAGHLSEECALIVMQHHERDDGHGYPRGLAGDEIHDYGRIGCIADVYDALTAERSYKKALTPFQALEVMKNEMIKHFHPDIFAEFVQLFRRPGLPKRYHRCGGPPPAGGRKRRRVARP